MEQLARSLLSKLRFFRIDNDFADLVSVDPAFVCLVAKTGLSIIESTMSPADSYYIEHVSFPGFVRRLNLECYIPAGCDIFYRSICFLSARFPQFYYDCVVWPASVR